jgi:hypothetical protein
MEMCMVAVKIGVCINFNFNLSKTSEDDSGKDSGRGVESLDP